MLICVIIQWLAFTWCVLILAYSLCPCAHVWQVLTEFYSFCTHNHQEMHFGNILGRNKAILYSLTLASLICSLMLGLAAHALTSA